MELGDVPFVLSLGTVAIPAPHLIHMICSGFSVTPQWWQNFLCPVGFAPHVMQATARLETGLPQFVQNNCFGTDGGTDTVSQGLGGGTVISFPHSWHGPVWPAMLSLTLYDLPIGHIWNVSWKPPSAHSRRIAKSVFLTRWAGIPMLTTKLYTLFSRLALINEFRSFNLVIDFAIRL